MKFLSRVLVALAIVSQASAQKATAAPTSTTTTSSSAAALIGTLPQCALNCLITQVSTSSCSLTNTTCVCTNAPLQASLAVCVTQSCTIKQALFTKNVTETICQAPTRNKQRQSYIITVTLGVLSAAALAARIGFRSFVTRALPALDDWFVIAAFCAGLPSTVINTEAVIPNGLGRDIWTLTPAQITNFGMFFYIMAVLYFLQITLLKMTLLFFYLRIFPEKGVQRLLWGTIIFNAIIGVFFVSMTIGQCQPISHYWLQWDGEHSGRCLRIDQIAWANAAISIALDLWMLAIPLFQVWKLHLHWEKKIGVAVMFCVGTFVTVVSILRLQTLVNFANSANPTWDFTGVSDWSVVEINVGIICTCLPALRLILVRIFPRLGGTTNASQKYYRSGGSSSSKPRKPSGLGSRDRSLISNPLGPAKKPAIQKQTSYTVQYGENDEQELVQLEDLDLNDDRRNVAKRPSFI